MNPKREASLFKCLFTVCGGFVWPSINRSLSWPDRRAKFTIFCVLLKKKTKKLWTSLFVYAPHSRILLTSVSFAPLVELQLQPAQYGHSYRHIESAFQTLLRILNGTHASSLLLAGSSCSRSAEVSPGRTAGGKRRVEFTIFCVVLEFHTKQYALVIL